MMRFPLHKQYDSMQCGLACLQMICDFFGTNYSLETISRYCFATTEGTSLRSINEAALKLGFHTIVGKVTIPQLKEASLPCILYWNQKHFIILYDTTVPLKSEKVL
ncbi:cysteine peptidase family C39 domain-containing protein [uncultured Bacteroides sp.]|uniref:cysteine peptidase family C39 domain-containing protein n=2 Tax=uncultured Bacteroides sp. TaxID=162156 RepID=UPI00338EF773